MSSSVFAFPIAVLLLLILVAAGYFLLYTSHINRALTAKGRGHLHMLPPYRVVMALGVIAVICAATLGASGLSGLSRIATAHDVEEDLRESRTVEEDWNVEIAMSDGFAAAIAYDDERSDHSFAIYRNAGDVFTAYTFRYGGHTTSVERGVSVYRFDDTLILLSMNAPHIERIVCHDGDTWEIDPGRPFVLILPSGGFDAYDSAGERIDLAQDWWYEERDAG